MRKMILGAAAAVVSLCGGAIAQDWHQLDGAGIAGILTGRFVRYDNDATQRFFASGRTLYTSAEPSWGQWRVDNDRYCSLWPPASEWDCYDLFTDAAGGVDFVDARGNRFPGVIVGD